MQNASITMDTRPNTLRILFSALRIYQWPKNLVVFAALVFAQELSSAHQLLRSAAAFAALCAASSAVYLFNDMKDISKDRAHPEKRHRPIASGALPLPQAMILMVVLALAAVAAAFALQPRYAAIVVLYMGLMVAYTLVLKNVIILDVLVVALGFVLRAMGGAVVLDVPFSNWLVVCTLFLALFLSLGKRRHEMELMTHNAMDHRSVLREYSVGFLDSLIMIVSAATLVTYTIYTCSPEVAQRLGANNKLYFTLPLVVYGLFRYLHLVHHKRGGGDPSRELLEDWPLRLTVLLWGLMCLAIMYARASA